MNQTSTEPYGQSKINGGWRLIQSGVDPSSTQSSLLGAAPGEPESLMLMRLAHASVCLYQYFMCTEKVM